MKSKNPGVPLYFYPVLLLAGMGSGIAVYVWFRMYGTLFGIHQFSITSILVVMLFCLAVGSRIGGALADKFPNRLLFFSVLQIILGFYTMLNPYIFAYLVAIFTRATAGFHLASFGIGLIRPVLTFLFLFIPLASIGGIIPVMSRNFIKVTSHAGDRISTISGMVFAGIFLGFLINGFFLIPGYGMHIAIRITSVLCLVSTVLVLTYVYGRKIKDISGHHPVKLTRASQRVMMFRKNKKVLEIGAKLTRAMLRVHAIGGFASASVLIIASRMMNEYTIVGTSCMNVLNLSVYFAAIAIGSGFYKAITAKTANGYLLMASLEILSGFAILLSFVLFGVTGPAVHKIILHPVSWWTAVLFQLLTVSSLLFLPGFFTGIMLPLSGSLFPGRLLHSGRNAGRLGSLFYWGALAAVLITPFIFLPLAGSAYSYLLLVVIAMLSGIYLLLRDSRLIRVFRLSYAAIAMACISGILFGLVKFGWINKGIAIQKGTIKEIREGSRGMVKLTEKAGGRKAIGIDGFESFETGKEGIRDQQLPSLLSAVLGYPLRSSLVIGFGMGLTASVLEDCNVPDICITEVFPEILSLSSRIFSVENNDILTSNAVNISVEDARLFIFRSRKRFDLITSGYTNINLVPGYFTAGFFHSCYSGLSDSGILAQVLPLKGIDQQEFRSLVRACSDVFPLMGLWYLSQDKVLLMAYKKENMPDYCTWVQRFHLVDQFGTFAKIGISDPESLLSRKMMDTRQLKAFAENAPENSDDRPYAEFRRTMVYFKDSVLINQLISNMNILKELPETEEPCQGAVKNIQKLNLAFEAYKHELISDKIVP